jgi:hypothetical protein
MISIGTAFVQDLNSSGKLLCCSPAGSPGDAPQGWPRKHYSQQW